MIYTPVRAQQEEGETDKQRHEDRFEEEQSDEHVESKENNRFKEM